MQLYFDEGVDYSVTDEFGNLINQQSMDNLPDGSYEISPYGGNAGVYTESTAQPLLGSITGATSSFSLGVAARRCYTVDKHRTAHDAVTTRGGVEVSPQGALVCQVPGHRRKFADRRLVLLERRPALPGRLGRSRHRLVVHVERQPAGGHYSRRQGKIDNCILKWGCIGTHYPQIELWVNGNGAWAAK